MKDQQVQAEIFEKPTANIIFEEKRTLNANGSLVITDLYFKEGPQGYRRSLSIIPSPTHNCQIFSIGSFNNLLAAGEIFYLPTLKQIAKHNWGKKMMLIDIHDREGYDTIVKKLFSEEEIVLKTPYISTRGTAMALYLLKFNYIPDPIPEPGA